jgi:hypothetical protein
MTIRIVSLCAVLMSGFIASPVRAGHHHWRDEVIPYWPAHHAIYQMQNDIAYWEANPDVDEGYKGPAILSNHAEIKRLQAAIAPRPPRYFTPCCYSRRPIHVR